MATGGTGDVLAGLVGALLAGDCRRARPGASGRGFTDARAIVSPRGSASVGSSRAIWARRSARCGRSGGDDGRAVHGAPHDALGARDARARKRLGALLQPGDVVALVGNLGAGKTSSSEACCEGAAVPAERCPRPSFAIVATYHGRIPVHRGPLPHRGRGRAVRDRPRRSRGRRRRVARGVGGPDPIGAARGAAHRHALARSERAVGAAPRDRQAGPATRRSRRSSRERRAARPPGLAARARNVGEQARRG